MKPLVYKTLFFLGVALASVQLKAQTLPSSISPLPPVSFGGHSLNAAMPLWGPTLPVAPSVQNSRDLQLMPSALVPFVQPEALTQNMGTIKVLTSPAPMNKIPLTPLNLGRDIYSAPTWEIKPPVVNFEVPDHAPGH